MADFTQAIQWLKEGKLIRRKGDGWFIGGNKFANFYTIETQNKCSTQNFSFADFESTDWEIYIRTENLIDKIFTINCSPENIKIGSQWFQPEDVKKHLISFYGDVRKECEADALGAGLGYLGVLRLMKKHFGDALVLLDETGDKDGSR